MGSGVESLLMIDKKIVARGGKLQHDQQVHLCSEFNRQEIQFALFSMNSLKATWNPLERNQPQRVRNIVLPAVVLTMASDDRSWMYNRKVVGMRGCTEEFTRGVKYTVEFARLHPECVHDGMLRCPCYRCRNLKVESDGVIKMHLMKIGFADNYKSFSVNVYKGYFVNGYVFHTEEYGQTKSTWNSGINLKGNME
ncbi:hypothetical protein OROMI_027641 [Orobanche minor]